MKSEKGQGLAEYAIMIALLAIIVIVVVATVAAIAAACLWLPALAVVLFAYWAPISAWGSGLVAGVMALDPMAIFVAAVIVVFLALVIFGGRRRS